MHNILRKCGVMFSIGNIMSISILWHFMLIVTITNCISVSILQHATFGLNSPLQLLLIKICPCTAENLNRDLFVVVLSNYGG